MAALPVEIRATLYDLASKSSRQVYLVGDLVRSDVGVGGGPILPPSGGGNGKPPGIWGGSNEPFPTPPIYLPEPPPDPPTNPSEPKPPPPGGGWGWHPEYGWGYFPMTGGKPQPPG